MITCKLEEDEEEEKNNVNEFKEEKYVITEMNSEKKVIETNKLDKNIGKKIKEEYKKNLKEKNYSRSIDTNIPKVKQVVMSNGGVETRIKVNNLKNAFKK
jgi:hypothetical protein